MKTMTAIAAVLFSAGVVFAAETDNGPQGKCGFGMKRPEGPKGMNMACPCCAHKGMQMPGRGCMPGPRGMQPGRGWMPGPREMQMPGPRGMFPREKSFMSYLPGPADFYPEEFAKAEALKKSNPEEAKKKMGEIRKKFVEQRMKEMKAVMDAAKAYRETKDEAKLKEAEKLIGAQIDAAMDNAGKKLGKLKKELDEIKKLDLSKDKAALISAIYGKEIAEMEKFVSADRKKMAEKFVERFKNAPQGHGMNRPGHHRHGFRGHRGPGAPAAKDQAK